MRSCALLLAIFVGTYAAVSEKCKNPPNQHVDLCCDGIDALITEKDFDDCEFVENMQDGKMPPCKIFNCLFKKYEMVAGPENKVNRAKSKDLLLKAYTNEWSPVAEEAIKTCFKELDDQKSPCESKSFLMCLYDHIIHNCPKERWNNTKECNDAKTFDEECGHRSIM